MRESKRHGHARADGWPYSSVWDSASDTPLAELEAAARPGDPIARRAFVARLFETCWASTVHAIERACNAQEADAEDAVSEVMCELLQRMTAGAWPDVAAGRWPAYLVRAARWTLIRSRHRLARWIRPDEMAAREAREKKGWHDRDISDWMDRQPGAIASPPDELDGRLCVQEAADVIRRLPRGSRRVLHLWMRGFAQQDIAKALRTSIGAVRVRLHVARKAIASWHAERRKSA